MNAKTNPNSWTGPVIIGIICGVVLTLCGVVKQGHVQATSLVAILGFLFSSFLWWKVRPWTMRTVAIFASAMTVAVFQGFKSHSTPDYLRFLGDDQNIRVEASYTNEPYRAITDGDGLGFDLIHIGAPTFKEFASITFTNSEGWLNTKLEFLQADIPHSNFVRRVQFTSSNVVDGRILTKRFGVIKVREYGNQQEIQMTESQIQAVKKALYDAKSKEDAERKTY